MLSVVYLVSVHIPVVITFLERLRFNSLRCEYPHSMFFLDLVLHAYLSNSFYTSLGNYSCGSPSMPLISPSSILPSSSSCTGPGSGSREFAADAAASAGPFFPPLRAAIVMSSPKRRRLSALSDPRSAMHRIPNTDTYLFAFLSIMSATETLDFHRGNTRSHARLPKGVCVHQYARHQSSAEMLTSKRQTLAPETGRRDFQNLMSAQHFLLRHISNRVPRATIADLNGS